MKTLVQQISPLLDERWIGMFSFRSMDDLSKGGE
jgi:hypothetical protein